MTHTPGPWAVNPFYAWIDCGQLDEDGDPTPVCKLAWPTKYRSEDETWANAHLIAAAPALLEALVGLMKELGLSARPSWKAQDKARAAITQARGQANG